MKNMVYYIRIFSISDEISQKKSHVNRLKTKNRITIILIMMNMYKTHMIYIRIDMIFNI